MKHRAWISPIAAVALALAACADRPLRTPKLTPLTPTEKTMECPQIHLAIDRADTVRWLIRDDGGKLETSNARAARYAGNVALVPLSVLLSLGLKSFTPLVVGDGGNALLNAADGRIHELLRLKRARGCPSRATGLPGMDDLALLGELESVQARLDAGRGEEAELFKERTRLLDGLRLMPAPAAVPAALVTPGPAKDEKPAATADDHPQSSPPAKTLEAPLPRAGD